MATAVYDQGEIATPGWWAELPPVQPSGWRGWLAVAYVRLMVSLIGLMPKRNMLSPAYDWPRARRIFERFDRVASVFPRSVARWPADEAPVDGEWFSETEAGAPSPGGRTILYVHGGSFVLDRTALHDVLAAHLALAAHANVLAVDYRLAPEHPFPAGLDDVVDAYRHLVESGIPPQRIAIVGDSAGGGLALAALLRLRDAGHALPAAFVALSPWADLTFSGSSIIHNARSDPFMSDIEFIAICAELYLQGVPSADPLASPALADLGDLPPTLVHVGSSDMLLDDSRRIVDGIRATGGKARLDIWKDMPHVWQRLASYIPEASASLDAIGQFMRVAIPDAVREREDMLT